MFRHVYVRTAASVLTASVICYSRQRHLHNDSPPINTLVWGSNRLKTLEVNRDAIRVPTPASWLTNVALRDLAFHDEHGAVVDLRGDLYQWGDAFAPNSHPTLTLCNKDIVQVRLTDTTVFCLSASGKIYALSVAKQKLSTTPSSSPWWSTGWLWGERNTVDFVEIKANTPLSWGEKFIDISSGNDHLLALTSSGRAFAHPINQNANAYGQLGFRKCEINDPSSNATVSTELIPKTVGDPYAKSTPFTRPVSSNTDPEQSDPSNRFCNSIFEIPSLKGLQFQRLTAGAKSSFALTTSGRVLGWGANEFGQIGLGHNIILDTILVPTEVNLWRASPRGMQTRCLDVYAGGDLSGFLVERSGTTSKTIELLMCGNGQWGGHGNNQFSSARPEPTRAKYVSGLMEYDDVTQGMVPIVPSAASISSSGHVLLTLDTSTGGGKEGCDLVVFGKNHDSELGNGRKSSLPLPTPLELPTGERFLLRKMIAKEVKDLSGKTYRNVFVEQRAVAGPGMSCVYWQASPGK